VANVPCRFQKCFPLAGGARTRLKSPQSETLGYLLVPQRAELGTFLDIAAEQILPPPLASRRTATRPRGRSKLTDVVRILVVEDDQLIQAMVEEALSEGGFEAALAASGEEAITLLEADKSSFRGA
jgi:hypothetical protein